MNSSRMQTSAGSILVRASRFNGMSMAPRLDLRQSQSLVMTPQLQQAIKLLALSNLEIESVIAEAVEANPLLETRSASIDPPGTMDEPPVPHPDRIGTDEAVPDGFADGEAALDVDISAERFDDGPDDRVYPTSTTGQSAGPADGEAFDADSFAAPAQTLTEYLLQQAGTAFRGRDLFVARDLIDQIDEAGYLTCAVVDVADRLNVDGSQVEAVLATIQTFDPTGVGARTLSECLSIQAKEADRYDPCMVRLIDNLDLLARGDIVRLRRLCDVDDEDMADMIRELRSYDPKPGCRIGSEAAPAIVPDIFVERRGSAWRIEINPETLPRVLVNRNYHRELSSTEQSSEAKNWLSDCLASANWLVKALDQRQRTIIRVATEIVKQQQPFFERGVAHLRPLTLRTVADAIEMHESTVSRVTSNKYLDCSRGVFELKYFFTTAIGATDGGDSVSAEAVKNLIRNLVASENASILSDDALVELLQERGINIARRTVAKYRESLGIGSSVQRRRVRMLNT